MKYLIILISFISCTHQEPDVHVNAIEKALFYTSHNAERNLMLLTRNYLNDPLKIGKYYQLGKNIDSICNEFDDYSNSINFDSTKINSKTYLLKYEAFVSSIYTALIKSKSIKPELDSSVLLLENKNMEFELLVLSSRLNARLCKSLLIEQLLGRTSSGCDWFISNLTTSKDSINDNSYSFNINSVYLQQLTDKNSSVISIDTILRNGELIKKKFNSKRVETFSRVKLNYLDEGDYYVKGHISIIYEEGSILDFPFKHKMKIN